MLIVCPNSGIDIQYEIDNFSNHNRVKNIIKQPGGKGFNVLRVLRQLGYEASLVTFAGKYNGRYIIDKSNEEGLNVFSTNIADDNRICLNIIGDNRFEILENGPTINEVEFLEYAELVIEKSRGKNLILLTGSEPKSNQSIYKYIVEHLASKVILDTSSKSLFDCYSEDIFGLKINDIEFDDLCKHLQITGDILQRLLQLKNDLILITLGENGTIVKYYDKIYKVNIEKYNVVNTTGSGDSLFAGLSYALVNNYYIEEALKLANACGILNALEERTGYINVELLENIISNISVEKLR